VSLRFLDLYMHTQYEKQTTTKVCMMIELWGKMFTLSTVLTRDLFAVANLLVLDFVLLSNSP